MTLFRLDCQERYHYWLVLHCDQWDTISLPLFDLSTEIKQVRNDKWDIVPMLVVIDAHHQDFGVASVSCTSPKHLKHVLNMGDRTNDDKEYTQMDPASSNKWDTKTLLLLLPCRDFCCRS